LQEGSVTPLAVKWADPELQVKKRRAVEESSTDNRMVGARGSSLGCRRQGRRRHLQGRGAAGRFSQALS
jgi:hypothetical protein